METVIGLYIVANFFMFFYWMFNFERFVEWNGHSGGFQVKDLVLAVLFLPSALFFGVVFLIGVIFGGIWYLIFESNVMKKPLFRGRK
ncbi:hypothetical protein AB3N02_21705 [Priestia aryabhattai]|uniref:hypothetical protein n=1 Tax=Priestia aryabhattai TaxID=412384 RepID=UPI0039A040F3